ncbi:MAG: hypothetical protein Q4G40_06925, partial [Brachybacterium sp.]|nr:hypothetical protein [Brachybacterium sp.]
MPGSPARGKSPARRGFDAPDQENDVADDRPQREDQGPDEDLELEETQAMQPVADSPGPDRADAEDADAAGTGDADVAGAAEGTDAAEGDANRATGGVDAVEGDA